MPICTDSIGYTDRILFETNKSEIDQRIKNVSGTRMCVFSDKLSPENETKSEKMIDFISGLITDKSLLFKIVKEEQNIEWMP